MPGIAACAEDVVAEDGTHPDKAGPCVRFMGLEIFVAMRNKLAGCGTGSALAKDRAAQSLTTVMIPVAQDYPV
jgi:hypothetical protein